jgi:hypothetical protein
VSVSEVGQQFSGWRSRLELYSRQSSVPVLPSLGHLGSCHHFFSGLAAWTQFGAWRTKPLLNPNEWLESLIWLQMYIVLA